MSALRQLVPVRVSAGVCKFKVDKTSNAAEVSIVYGKKMTEKRKPNKLRRVLLS